MEYLQVKSILLKLSEEEIESVKSSMSIGESNISDQSKDILERLQSDKILYIIIFDCIQQIEILEVEQIEKLFEDIHHHYFPTIFRFNGLHLTTLIDLELSSRLILLNDFTTEQIATLIEEFDEHQLDYILTFISSDDIIKLIEDFSVDDRNLLIQDALIIGDSNITFVINDIELKKRRELFETLDLNEKIKFLELKNETKRIIIDSYNVEQIKLLLSNN